MCSIARSFQHSICAALPGRSGRPSMQNKANSRPVELGLSTFRKEDCDERHGPWLCENKANSRDRDCFGAPLLAMTGRGERPSCKAGPIRRWPVMQNKANLAGPARGRVTRSAGVVCAVRRPAVQNKANLRRAESLLTVFLNGVYDEIHRLGRRESKANRQIRHRAKQSQFARAGAPRGGTSLRPRMRSARAGCAKQSQSPGWENER